MKLHITVGISVLELVFTCELSNKRMYKLILTRRSHMLAQHVGWTGEQHHLKSDHLRNWITYSYQTCCNSKHMGNAVLVIWSFALIFMFSHFLKQCLKITPNCIYFFFSQKNPNKTPTVQASADERERERLANRSYMWAFFKVMLQATSDLHGCAELSCNDPLTVFVHQPLAFTWPPWGGGGVWGGHRRMTKVE